MYPPPQKKTPDLVEKLYAAAGCIHLHMSISHSVGASICFREWGVTLDSDRFTFNLLSVLSKPCLALHEWLRQLVPQKQPWLKFLSLMFLSIWQSVTTSSDGSLSYQCPTYLGTVCCLYLAYLNSHWRVQYFMLRSHFT